MMDFNELFEDKTKYGTKLKTSQYQENGKNIIVDQGQSDIAGYTNIEEGLFTDVPVIIFGDHTRVVKYVDQPFFLGADGTKILKSKYLDANYKYLYYALKYIKIPNTGYNRHYKWLKESKFKYPAKKEQKQIVFILDKTTNLIQKYNNQLKLLDELVKARFVELFGNPLDGTAKYPIHQVGEVANSVDPQPSHRTPPVEEGGIPYVSIKDCDYKTGKIDFEGARKVSPKVLEEHMNRYTLHDGDFVVGKIGTIGNPVFVPARNDYTLSANVVLIQPNSELVSPYFLKYSFESDFVERQFAEAKNSTSQAAFGIQKVRTVEVMNPDLDVQREFEIFVKQVDKSKFEIQKSLEKTQQLYDSLMQKYFG